MNSIEQRIVRRLIDTLFEAGYTLGVNDGEDTTVKNSSSKKEIVQAMATTDHDYLLVYKDGRSIGWVMLVWGNDEDVISDHSAHLTEVIEPVMQWIENPLGV